MYILWCRYLRTQLLCVGLHSRDDILDAIDSATLEDVKLFATRRLFSACDLHGFVFGNVDASVGRSGAGRSYFLHDLLRKILRSPIYLDSSSLTDLRALFSEGIHQSDTVLLMATKGVLTRPWCVVE